MKRLGALFLLCLALCALPAAGSAAAEPLRVGMPEAFSAFMVTADEAHAALLSDTLLELAKYTNWTYEFITAPDETLLAMLKRGELDLLAGVYYRDDLLDAGLLYPRHLACYTYAVLVADPADDTVQRDDFRSMQDKRIAAAKQMAETGRLLSFLSLSSVRGTILYTDSAQESARMLRSGEADMALLSSELAGEFRAVAEFVVEPYYIAAAPGRDSLVSAMDSAYAMILDADPDYVESLYDKHFGWMDRRSPKMTRAETEFTGQLPKLRVAVPGALAPLQSYHGDPNSEPIGISIEVLRHVRSFTGLQMELVYAKGITEAVAMVASGEADMAVGLPYTDESAMESGIVMTRGYLEAPRVAICNEHVNYPSVNMTLALVPGTEYLIDTFTGETVYAETFWECVDLVSDGVADYTYGISYFLESGVQAQALRGINTYTIPGETTSFGIGLRQPAYPLLLTSINKALSSISEDTMLDIVMRNTTLHEEPQTFEDFLYSYPLLAILIAVVFVVLVAVAVIIFTVLRARHNQALYRTQFSDELTGALNLAGFRREANRLLQTPGSFALSYSTVRNFHFINERYGYEAGDSVIRCVADAYRASLGEGELYCRVSGGTFVALQRYTTEAEFFARADGFDAEVAAITPRADSGHHIRMMTGIYLNDGTAHGDVFSMMDRANAAQQQIRYSAEQNRAVYQEGSYDSIMYLQELESRMVSALETGQFLVYLQPKYCLATMKPGGAEALVRWFDGNRVIPPSDFIPQFERNGFVARLDRYVFEQCCITLRRWLDADMPCVPISINVSRVQLYSPTFLADYVTIRDKYAIPHGLLELEFTESILFEDVDKLIELVMALHRHGFECSIDDFGKGYSSLTMLKNIPADVLKLDAQFFDTGIDAQRDMVIVESILDITKSLNMTSVAEGIEHRNQVSMLQMLGCDMIQGYIFSRPLDIASFEQYLREKIIEGRDPYAPLGEG